MSGGKGWQYVFVNWFHRPKALGAVSQEIYNDAAYYYQHGKTIAHILEVRQITVDAEQHLVRMQMRIAELVRIEEVKK